MFPCSLACIQPETSQTNIKDLAEKCLHSNPYLALKNISSDYRDGVLTLRGCLPTYYLKQLAQEAVSNLDGVDRIDNQIDVVAPAFRLPRG